MLLYFDNDKYFNKNLRIFLVFIFNLGDVSMLTNDGRMNLFSKGVEFERKGKAG